MRRPYNEIFMLLKQLPESIPSSSWGKWLKAPCFCSLDEPDRDAVTPFDHIVNGDIGMLWEWLFLEQARGWKGTQRVDSQPTASSAEPSKGEATSTKRTCRPREVIGRGKIRQNHDRKKALAKEKQSNVEGAKDDPPKKRQQYRKVKRRSS